MADSKVAETNFAVVYAGRVDVGDVYRTYRDEQDGIRIGGVDFLWDLENQLDSSELYHVSLFQTEPVQSVSHKWAMSSEPFYTTAYRSRLQLWTSSGLGEADAFAVMDGSESDSNIISQLTLRDGKPVTLIVSKMAVFFDDLPTPEGR